MKSYPSIPTLYKHRDAIGKDIYFFDKLDGSNIRVEWTPKLGFNKFGSRKQLISDDQPILKRSIEIISTKYESQLHERFLDSKIEKATLFFEFLGSKSHNGFHYDDDKFDAVLFDIDIYKKGLMQPVRFIEFTDGLQIPSLLHVGELTDDIFFSVRRGELTGMTHEGVVAKYAYGHHVKMFKIKSLHWLMRNNETE